MFLNECKIHPLICSCLRDSKGLKRVPEGMKDIGKNSSLGLSNAAHCAKLYSKVSRSANLHKQYKTLNPHFSHLICQQDPSLYNSLDKMYISREYSCENSMDLGGLVICSLHSRFSLYCGFGCNKTTFFFSKLKLPTRKLMHCTWLILIDFW